ncbi:dicarboxylate transporter/tellurite-resistance protein TehA [Canicola haemoglobinophilus]|nr:dicarboxylate transporter/tellurite-resistance protein TehA [Canicola haemoglobinophilus]
MMTSETKPFFMPTGHFSMSLGLGGLTLAWRQAEMLFPYASLVEQDLTILSVGSWALFILLYLYKILKYYEQVQQELSDPIRVCILALIPLSSMVIGAILYKNYALVGKSLILLSVAGQTIFSVIYIGGFLKGKTFNEEAIQPTFYLPTIAVNFTSGACLALIGLVDLAYVYLGTGFLSWIFFEPLMLQRLRLNEFYAPLRPTLGIVLAPAFVGSSAYLAINGGELDLWVKLLWGYGLLQLFFMLRLLPWIAEKGFTLSFWAFSFGLAAIANDAIVFINKGNYPIIGTALFVFANMGFVLLLIITLKTLWKREFWLK